MKLRSFLLATLVLAGSPLPAAPPSPDYAPQTAVIYNTAAPGSKGLAEAYAKARKIPTTNLVGLPLPLEETITREQFIATLETPLREVFNKRGWWKLSQTVDGQQAASENRIRVLALMSGVPLRISEQAPPPSPIDPATGKPKPPAKPARMQENQSSVDSELVLLGLPDHQIAGAVNNPYYNKDAPFAQMTAPMMMLVGRLDGPTIKIAERLITDALTTEATGLWGRVYLDLARKGASYDEGDKWLLLAGKSLGTSGWPVIIDAHPETLPKHYPMTEAAVYLGWYTRTANGPLLNPAFRFKRGSLATHLHSYSATTIRSTTQEWVGPLLDRGAAAVLGNTWEPYLTLTTHFDVYIDRLLKGYTLAEAAWMATPAASWMSVVIGDPLYRPFVNCDSSKPAGPMADFQLYHQLIGRLGNAEDKTPLLSEVEKAATARNSGVLWEALGFLCQSYVPDDIKRAAVCFEKAAQAYSNRPDKIRAYLQVPDLQRRNGMKEGAIADLKRIMNEFPKEPETEAARQWLNTLQPPPPPAPKRP